MKKLYVLLLACVLVFASDIIPFNKVENLAQRFVNQRYGTHRLDEVITYHGLDELPGAYALVYRNNNNEPLTIIMGARYTSSPVNEISKALPRSKDAFDAVLNKARTLGYGEPEFQKYYYFGPGEEYCAFKCGDQDFLINSCTFRIIEKAELFLHKPEPMPELERLTREKWEKYFNTANFTTRQDSGYVPGVPWIDWVYGCSPTAASMIFWYWDPYGYGRLVDYFFTRWDPPYEAWKDCANVNKELALAMYTDSMTGGTYISNIRNGMITVANSYNGYSCSGSTSPQGNAGNQYQFSWIKGEINAGRPCHWNVLHYYYGGQFINHSITGVGYHIILPDTFVQVHTTWGWSGEPLWALWTVHNGSYSYDYVITFIPGGMVNDNIFLDGPQGPGFVFKNMKYKIKWTNVGSQIDHVKIWYSIGRKASSYDSLYWTLITANAPNTGDYLWTAPDQDSSLRINIAGLSSSNQRLAADGGFDPLGCVFPDYSSNLALVGHLIAPSQAYDVVINGNYAYVANGTAGLMVADISDSSMPEEVTSLSLPGNSTAMCQQGSYLYIADRGDTMRVVSISTPTNPTQVGKVALSVDQPRGLYVTGSRAYVACRGTGVEIVDISTPSSPLVIGSFDTPGQAYDIVVEDTFAYIADGTLGLRIWSIADPSNPYEIGYDNTNGITQGIDKSGDYVYLAEGGAGIKVFDVNDPANPQQLGTLDTPGTAQSVLKTDSLYVCDGSGGLLVIDVSTPGSPTQVGYLENFGNATNVAHVGELLYLADVGDGIYIIHEDLLPAIQEMIEQPLFSKLVISSPQTNCLKFNIVLEQKGDLYVNIYDAAGRLVKSIDKIDLDAGEHNFKWSANAAGVYFVRIETAHGTVAKKVVFLK